MTEVRRGGMAFGVDEVELVEVVSEDKPDPVNPFKGKTKYPFDQIAVGGGMRVKRDVSTVKGACRRWQRAHKGVKFSIWRLAGGWVMVKRIK